MQPTHRTPEGAEAVIGVAELVSPDGRYIDASRRKYGLEYAS